jgi:hypothetical protein
MTTPIHLDSLNKDITLNPYTRKISRAVQEKLLENVNVETGSEGMQKTTIPAVNADRSEELAVKLVSGLSDEEMDNLSVEDYQTLKAAVQEATTGKKKE